MGMNDVLPLPIGWLHPQKTGTSFGNVLVSSCTNITKLKHLPFRPHTNLRKDLLCACNNVLDLSGTFFPMGRAFGSHAPLIEEYDLAFAKHFVLMLRSPTQQLYSMRDHSHKRNMDICEFVQNPQGFQGKQRPKGFQTQFMLGYNFKPTQPQHRGRSLNATKEHAAYASILLQHLGFVGITDFFHASSCLLLEFMSVRLGRKIHLPGKALTNVRASKASNHAYRERMSLSRLGCSDDVDELLFQAALDIFLRHLMRSECLRYLKPADLGTQEGNRKLEYALHIKRNLFNSSKILGDLPIHLDPDK